jgi:hypothetical protein
MVKRHSSLEGRNPGTAPRLTIRVSPEQWDTAKQSDSGGCLIADAIKRDYPTLRAIHVDMATIRVTDPARCERYIWLTPGVAQTLLLSFDQGWRQLVTEPFQLRECVQITKSRKVPRMGGGTGRGGRSSVNRQNRADRRTELETMEADGVLTKRDANALRRIRETDARHEIFGVTTTQEPVSHVEDRTYAPATVHGGRPMPTGVKHPNLLATRTRHFGAKLATPGQVFEEAVEEQIRQRLADADAAGATQSPPASAASS